MALISSGSDDISHKVNARFGLSSSWRKGLKISFITVLVSIMLLTSFRVLVTSPSLDSEDVTPTSQLDLTPEPTPHYLELLSHLYPGSPNRRDHWENENHRVMHSLITCMGSDSCAENQTTIVMLSSHHFATAICEECRKGGEDIWAMSVYISLQDMGYTAIFTPHYEDLTGTYRRFPDLVKVIIMDGSAADKCFKDTQCIKSPANPTRNKWTLSPENYSRISPDNSKDNFYLGYTIERTCINTPMTPVEERPQRAYILAKYLSYFAGDKYAWSKVSLIPPFPLTLVAGMINDTEDSGVQPPIDVNFGLMNQTDFYRELGRSRILIGIGRPALSPTPRDALCMGVPFINPIMDWDSNDPENRDKWRSQHDGLKYEDPPRVYNVRQGDEEGLWSAVRAALDNPIDRYISPEMTMEALEARVACMVEKDWRRLAEILLDERVESGSDKLFDI